VITYQDYVCPFCYVAEAPLARVRAEGLVLDRRPFELRPPPEPLADLRSPLLRHAWEQAVLPLAQRYGVEIREPARSVRTRKAHEAVAFARAQGRTEEMHAAIFRAHFVEGRDIGRIDVLAAIGGEVGLDAGDLMFALNADRWTEQVVGDERAAAALGITAVPAFVRRTAEGVQALFGVRDPDTLHRWARSETDMERDA
jgi:predicted DsbA family dithiol-disulfide isomerase